MESSKRLIKNFNNTLVFIINYDGLDRLVQYDILNKSKSIIFQSPRICDYHIDNSNLIIFKNDDDYYLYRDNKIEKPNIICLGGYKVFRNMCILNLMNEYCVAIDFLYEMLLCCSSKIIKVQNKLKFCSSPDGKKIAFWDSKIHIRNIEHIDVNQDCDLFNNFDNLLNVDCKHILHVKWLSSDLIVVVYYNDNDECKELLHNFKTDMHTIHEYHHYHYIFGDKLILVDFDRKKIKLYDISELTVFAVFGYDFVFLHYNCCLNIIIDSNMQYYKIVDCHYLEKIDHNKIDQN